MGYTTDFDGSVTINKKVDKATYDLLVGLHNTRRMKRDLKKLAKSLKITEKEALARYGKDGQLFVGATGHGGQDNSPDIVDYNAPPQDQPGLWCQWEIQEDHKTIQWDGGEKFYNYIEWMQYLIEIILKPKGYVVNGEIQWQGEEPEDKGIIRVENNTVRIMEAVTFFLSSEDAVRVNKIVNDYLHNSLKEVIDETLDKK